MLKADDLTVSHPSDGNHGQPRDSALDASTRKSQRAVFLDRDGTLNRNVEYLIDFEQFELIPGVEVALRLLQDLDYRLFVVSNQSGVARGYFPIEAVEALHVRIGHRLTAMGIDLEEFVFCPHHPQGSVPEFTSDCSCRKPKPGMLHYLQQKYALDIGNSYMVGDMLRDAEAGVNAGATGVLIKPDGDPEADWDRVDNPGNIKEFVSLLDFAESLRDIG